MDKTFVKFVEDYTRDGWSFLSTPKELEIQKDDDFMHTFEYISIASPAYRDAHKNMIQSFVDSCRNDEADVPFHVPFET